MKINELETLQRLLTDETALSTNGEANLDANQIAALDYAVTILDFVKEIVDDVGWEWDGEIMLKGSGADHASLLYGLLHKAGVMPPDCAASEDKHIAFFLRVGGYGSLEEWAKDSDFMTVEAWNEFPENDKIDPTDHESGWVNEDGEPADIKAAALAAIESLGM